MFSVKPAELIIPGKPSHTQGKIKMQGKTESVDAVLKLTRTEESILTRLAKQGCLAREQMCALVTRAHQPIKPCSAGVIVRGLRKKLAAHGVKIATAYKFGWTLCRGDCEKVRELLATQPRPTTTAKQIPDDGTEAAGAKSRPGDRMRAGRCAQHPSEWL